MLGRPVGLVLVVVGLVAGVALLDGRRDAAPDPAATDLAPRPTLTVNASPPEGSAADPGLGDTSYLLSCLGSALEEAGDGSPSPSLSPRGVRVISRRMERLRELEFGGPVDVAFLNDAAIDRRISKLVDRGYPASLARREGIVLELLGAIPPGSDLLALTRSALSAQVLGLFVPETEELLVASSGDAGAEEQLTLAHELEHALAFDDLGFPLPERVGGGRSDRNLAVQAVIEGDATLAMELYALRYVDLGEQLSLLDDPAAAAGARRFERLPYILQRQLLFPYEAGLRFVCDRYERGGWRAVDRAYERPPESTAELLDPGAATVVPEAPRPPAELPEPWRRTLSEQLGAAELSWLFEAPGGEVDVALPDPAGAAADWRGGRLELWQRDGRSALAISLAARPGGTLCGAMIAWYGASFPDSTLTAEGDAASFAVPGQSATIACGGGGVRVGIGPDPAVAAELAG